MELSTGKGQGDVFVLFYEVHSINIFLVMLIIY